MAHSAERKTEALNVLYTRASGNASKCARLTGIDRKTIQTWKEEYESTKKMKEETKELPDIGEIQERIIRRVYTIIENCSDPKKLMETYEALEKMKKESRKYKQSIFDIISSKLADK